MSKRDGRPDAVKHIKWRVLSNGSWAASWQRSINSAEDQAVFGTKVVTRYIGVVTEREADAKARAFDGEHDKRLKALRSLPSDDRAYVGSLGGYAGREPLHETLERVRQDLGLLGAIESPVGGLQQRIDALTELVALGEQARQAAAQIDHTQPQWGMTAEQVMGMKLDALQGSALQKVERAELNRAKSIAVKVALVDDADTLDGLLTLWIQANPNSKVRKYKTSLERLKAHVGGNLAWRSITREQCLSWRDALAKEYPPGSPTPNKHLDNIRSLFKAARIKGLITKEQSPARDVNVHIIKNHNSEDAETGRPFSGEQITTGIEYAEVRLIHPDSSFDALREPNCDLAGVSLL